MEVFAWIEGQFTPGSNTDLRSSTSVRTSAHCRSEVRNFCRLQRQAAHCGVRSTDKTRDQVRRPETVHGNGVGPVNQRGCPPYWISGGSRISGPRDNG